MLKLIFERLLKCVYHIYPTYKKISIDYMGDIYSGINEDTNALKV